METRTEFCDEEKYPYGKAVVNITGYILVDCFDQKYNLQCKLGETMSVPEIKTSLDNELLQGYEIYTEKPELIMKFYPSGYILAFETAEGYHYDKNNLVVIRGYIPEGSDVLRVSEESLLTNAFHPVSVSLSLGKLTGILEETVKDLSNLYI